MMVLASVRYDSIFFFFFAAVCNISDVLEQVISDQNTLISASDNLTTAMNDLGTDIDATKSTCSSSSVACQTACDTMDTTVLKSGGADFSSVRCF